MLIPTHSLRQEAFTIHNSPFIICTPPTKTLGIYAQVPFCASKCTFCNFSSQVAPQRVFHAYCSAVESEIERLSALYCSAGIDAELLRLPVDTIYFGGGTPSLLGAERLGGIARAIARRFGLASELEFTLELTPGSADDALLDSLRSLGVNRLSVGAQSFSDRELAAVGRLHSAADTVEQVLRARRAGYFNIGLDLIAGLPHQTEASWLETLKQVASLSPEHISVYLFEVDEKSRLGNEVLRHGDRYHADIVPDDDFMADAYETAREFLRTAGYEQYEISNFARAGFESRHNRKYWRLQPYIGLGAGAHSSDGLRRWSNEIAPETYQARLAQGESPIAESRSLSSQEQIEEFFFLGLRQCQGVDLEWARTRWGAARLAPWAHRISALQDDGLLERRDQRLRLPEQAYLVSNEVFEQFLI